MTAEKHDDDNALRLGDGLGYYNLPWLDNTEFVLNLTDNIQVKITRMPLNQHGYCASIFLNKCIVNLDNADLAAKRIVEFAKQEFTSALDGLSKYENSNDV